MKIKHTLSIIVPIYNVELYLEKCLKSIQDSIYTDFEVIMVDDGSSDLSGMICDIFSNQDDRFMVFHIKNSGVSHARNVGIDKAEGTYIMFIDSDDYIESNYLSEVMIQNDEDFSYAGYKDCFEKKILKKHEEKNCTFDLAEIKWRVKQCGRQAIPYVVWRGCYRADIIKKNKLRFLENISLGEDILFNLSYFEHCNKFRSSSNCGYCHNQVKTSLIHKYYSDMMKKEENEISNLEKFAGIENMRWRYYGWHVTIKYYKEWIKKGDFATRKDAKKRLKKSYRSQYFRKSISYIRNHGTADERVETYFMGYYRYPLFEMIYKIGELIRKGVYYIDI